MVRQIGDCGQEQQRALDTRIVTSELIEALAVLALPALLFSSLGLFFH